MSSGDRRIFRMQDHAPNGWRFQSLYDLADYINGRAFRQSELGDKGLPVIKIAELHNGITASTKYYDGKIEEWFYLKKGELLFAWSGSVGVFTWNGGPAVLNQHIFKVKAKPGIDQKFLKYLLQFHMPIFELLVKDKATTMGHVRIEDLKSIEAAIPPLHEQRKIAEILGSLDDKIELNYEMNKTLEAIAQAIFENWFVDFEPFKDKLVYSKELGKKLPEGWEIKPISEVIHVNPPRKLRKGTVARKISMSDLKPWQSWIESWSYEEYKGGPTFQNGDTLFARITPSLEHGKTALVLILDEREIAFGTTEFIVLAPKVIKSDYYVFCLARTRDVREKAIRAMSGSSGRQRVPDDIFDRILIPVPPEEVIKEFNNIASPLFEMITVNAKENLVLARIRDALLPKLLSGEIRVKVDVEEEFPEETKKLEDIGRKKAKIQVSLEEWLRHG
jgi:type I restriction enzyme S subunit